MFNITLFNFYYNIYFLNKFNIIFISINVLLNLFFAYNGFFLYSLNVPYYLDFNLNIIIIL